MNRAGAPRLLLALQLLVMGSPAPAEIYQWRDEEGKLHYSDRKPKHVEVEDVTDRATVTNIDESGAQRDELGRIFKPETREERHLRRQEEQQQARHQQQLEQRCASARHQLRILQGPVYFTREDGSSYSISEKEREQRAAEFEAQIRRYCGS